MAVKWNESIVERIEPLAHNVRRFFIKSQGIIFKAGQFITLDLPIGEKRQQRWRSYSIASAPSGGAELELCIVRSPFGLGTQYLFDEVGVGSVLRWKGPEGAFVLPACVDRDLVMICTGTGIAPFRSMIREIRQMGIGHRSIHLIFGTRTEADILYGEEFESLSREWAAFTYDIVLSRSLEWRGFRGYVHQVYQQKYALVRPDVHFLLCGWSAMVDQAVSNLALMGYDRTQVQFELYG